MAGTPGDPLHILLVEDNEAHAELAIRSLRNQPDEVTIRHVMDGEQALDYLFCRGSFADRDASPRPGIILLDLRLPRVDGAEVLRTVKATPALQRIPVIVLTSSDAAEDIAQAYDHHANSYVVKSLNFRVFSSMLNDIVNYWREWNRLPPAS